MVESEDRTLGVVPAVCLYDVTCTPKNARSGLSSIPYMTHCTLDGDYCKDLSDCIAENRKNVSSRAMIWTKGSPDGKKPDPDAQEKFGRQCKYSWGSPYVVFRQHPGKEYWDTVCASPISECNLPESVKGSFLATCKAGEQTKEGLMECPPAQDCLANAIPVKPSLTASNAKKLAKSGDRKKDQVDLVTTSTVNASLVSTPPVHKK